MIRIAEGIVLNDNDIEERFVRAVGPGGRNPNKEATAVELRVDIGASSLPLEVKNQLRRLAGRAVVAGDELVVVSRVHPSQARNREEARARLVTLLQRAATAPKTRKASRPTAVARENRIAAKKVEAGIKQSRRRVRGDE